MSTKTIEVMIIVDNENEYILFIKLEIALYTIEVN
jgi:hypothetical protein